VYCEETIGENLMNYGGKVRAEVGKKSVFVLKVVLVERCVDCATMKCFEMWLGQETSGLTINTILVLEWSNSPDLRRRFTLHKESSRYCDLFWFS
jgi:hypothetical protein